MKEAFFKLLHSNEAIFKLIEENPGHGLSYWQAQHLDRRYISPTFSKNLGYSSSDPILLSAHWRQLVADEDHLLFQSLPGRDSSDGLVNIQFRHKNLGPVLFSNRVIRVPATNDEPPGILLLHRLAGPSPVLHETARLHARRLKEMISLHGETMWVMDAEFRVTEYYEGGLDLSQTPSTETPKGRFFHELNFPREAQLLLIEAMNDARIEGTKANVEFKTEVNGQPKFYIATVGYVPGDEETVLVIRDVTEEKEAVVQLARLSSLAAKTNDSTILTDPKGVVTWVNEAFEQLSGFSGEEVVGSPAVQVFCGPETDSHSVQQLEESFRTCAPLSLSVVSQSRIGRKFWLDIRLDPVFNEVGHCTHFVCVGRDVTEHKIREEELLTARQFLLQTNQVAQIGGWSYEVASDLVRWTDVMYDLHEVDHDFEPTVERVINFYEEGESRNRYYEAGMNAIQFGTPYNIDLNLITAKGNKIRVRAIGNAEMEDGICTRLYGTFQRL